MVSQRRERGEGKVGCVVWMLFLAIAVLVAWKAIPVKMRTAELYDFMLDTAKFSAQTPAEEVKRQILIKAKALEIPLDKERLSVEKGSDRIRMKADYTVPLEFPGYTYNWNFHHEVDRPVFIF
jgi:hypothetical protein